MSNTSMRWMLIAAALAACTVMAAAAQKPPAPASVTPAPTAATAPAASQSQEIVAGGVVILRLRSTVSGMTPTARAIVLYERLNQIISDQSVRPADIKTVRKGADWMIMAGSHLFVTVTEAEARVNHTTPVALAEVWASNLRLAVPLARPIPPPPGGPYNE